MKILHTGDWHIGNFNGPEVDGKNARFLDICNCLNSLVASAIAETPDFIIVAGDLFHQAKVWSDRGLKENQTAIHYIRLLEKVAPVIILRGTPNHDSEQQFEMLKTAFYGDDSVHIITEPGVIKICGNHGNTVQIAALPGFDRGYYRAKHPGLSKEEENGLFTDELEKIIIGMKASCDNECPAVLVSHYTIPGCNMESGQTQFFSQFEPVVYPATLNAAAFDLVCFGHIHRPQQITEAKATYYCGAISALNFNDEGQERGFYIHEIDNANAVSSHFVTAPTREFCTIRLNDEQVAQFNDADGNIDSATIGQDLQGKIVRVLYDCTDEHNKALNKTLLEQLIYSAGAFWVQEITPQKITITVNKNGLSDTNSPEDNLREYLAEKDFTPEQIGEMIETARPIISEALENNMTEAKTGVFVPVEIDVKNYRNYREETFSFDGIRFCTINGSNGVGKSSLFMDAMADALFEETREGDLTGWICNDEQVRSGAIKFTFRLGDRLYRITRTRQKSGKATLNIAEFLNGDWVDRSKEKFKDTQAEIINIIGMDSLTLKACALIMQDQYGLFLQADKEARMNILGNILGLAVYGHMEDTAADKLTQANRDLRVLTDKVTSIASTIPDAEQLSLSIEGETNAIESLQEQSKKKLAEIDGVKVQLNTLLEAGQRVIRLQGNISTLAGKKAVSEGNKSTQAAIIFQADATLLQEAEITAGVAEYNSLLEQEKQLIANKAIYDDMSNQRKRIISAVTEIESGLNNLEKEHTSTEKKITEIKFYTDREPEITGKHEEYDRYTAEITAMEVEYEGYTLLANAVKVAEMALERLKAERQQGKATRNNTILAIEKKVELLNDSGCPDIAKASCRFLKDAVEASNALEPAKQELAQYNTDSENVIREAENALTVAQENLANTKYNTARMTHLRGLCGGLRQYEDFYILLSGQKEQLKTHTERLHAIEQELLSIAEKITLHTEELSCVDKKLKTAEIGVKQYEDLQKKIEMSKIWTEKEKLLPVAREKKQSAAVRIEELNAEIVDIEAEISEKTAELEKEKQSAFGSDELKIKVDAAETEISTIQREVQQHSMTLGALKKQQEQAAESDKAIKDLQKQAENIGHIAAIFEELKKAFSQDGIPHNITRSIIPIFEATASNILGQMSGGKMSVEFMTEKLLKSNSKKEVTTLDIIINDSDTGRLAYMSRSGGERVKAALSVILALSEIKSTKAGVQLGFLFIDEPPFLDAPGVQAYCDALEAIQSRYSDLKVMAITHDPAMKSRFPQSVDIVKTAEGSKVIYD
ncbi:MAG: exonuclease subunit SbcD [Oscillospiraceae bacterium]